MTGRPALALGLMSGTSGDGLSLALIRVPGRTLEVVAHETYPYERRLRERILAAGRAQTPELCRLNFELGRLFAGTAEAFLRRCRVAPRRLAAVGTHGQTVVHLPDGDHPSTLQIGEPSFLAERLGAPVVSDFRPRDMAAGGQGAPLVPFLDEFLFGGGPPRALLNIGGIANISSVGRGARRLGFDTGPGNCLMDAAALRITRGRQAFDKDGLLARRGIPDLTLARRLARLPFFRRRPPKSLDRGEFGEAFLERHFGRLLRRRPLDAEATLTYLTALTVSEAFQGFIQPGVRVRELVVSGGGVLNPVLLAHLRFMLAPLPVESIVRHGIAPLAKEPAAFALLALKAVQGIPNSPPWATGARGPRILGKISPPI